MDLLHTFDIYTKQLEILRKGNYQGRPQILRQYRMQFKGFCASDLILLQEYLQDNDKKWFVTHLLNNLDHFPAELLKPMLIAAVNEPDPSLNNGFVKPCRRVFDYVDILRILLGLFNEGETTQKIRVLNVFYWMAPTVYSTQAKSGIRKTKKRKGYATFFWDYELKSFNEDFIEDEAMYERERPRQDTARNELLACFEDTLNHTDDPELKRKLTWHLQNKTC